MGSIFMFHHMYDQNIIDWDVKQQINKQENLIDTMF